MLIQQEGHYNELCQEYMYQDQSTKLFGQDCYKVTLVTIHQSTGHSIPKNMDLHQHFCENLKSHKLDNTTMLRKLFSKL